MKQQINQESRLMTDGGKKNGREENTQCNG